MEWLNILITVLATLGGATGIVMIYTARTKKKGMEVENLNRQLEAMTKIIDEAQEERTSLRKEMDNMRELHKAYEEKMDAKFEKQELKLELVSTRSELRVQSMYLAYRCQYSPQPELCPVLIDAKEKQDPKIK